MTRIILTALTLFAFVIAGCSTTLTLKDGGEISGHIISSNDDVVRLQPDIEHTPTLRERGWAYDGYRGGAVDIPTDAIADQSNAANASVGLVFGTLSLGLFATNIALGVNEPLFSIFFMPFSSTLGGIAAPFIAEWWDQALGGSENLRLGLAITGTTVAALGPLLIPAALAVNINAYLLHITGIMPPMIIIGASLAIWGWDRWVESTDDAIINNLTVTPTAVVDRNGDAHPALGIGFSW